MFLHIEFTNGSNPYYLYGPGETLEKDLKRWEKNYNTISRKDTPDGIMTTLEEKKGEIWGTF